MFRASENARIDASNYQRYFASYLIDLRFRSATCCVYPRATRRSTWRSLSGKRNTAGRRDRGIAGSKFARHCPSRGGNVAFSPWRSRLRCQYLAPQERALTYACPTGPGFRGEAAGGGTYPPFFPAHSEKYVLRRVESGRFLAGLPTSTLRSMPLSNTSTTKLDNFDGNRRSASERTGGREREEGG